MSNYSEDVYLDHFQQYVESDGDLELDRCPDRENIKVSLSSDGGAYVLCWKWIDDADIDISL